MNKSKQQFSIYSIIKLDKLKKELQQFGLNQIKGKRETLIQYHKEYCLRMQSENDSINPISHDEIVTLIHTQYTNDKKKKPIKELSESEKKQKVKEMVVFLKKMKKLNKQSLNENDS